MIAHRISYGATQRFSSLVLDHCAQDTFLEEFQTFAPTLRGLRDAAGQRAFDARSRAVLIEAVKRQYAGIRVEAELAQNITRLAQSDALTVTTGHQLCLFLGPLYVPFKLLNAIRLARTLSEETGRPVVPVFWMASEDHDRAEIDHTWFGEHRLHWPGAAGGAVGRMPLHGIAPVVEEACSLLGQGDRADAMRALVRECYRPEHTLAEATRRFAHALFGRFGLVIIDGDDPALKRLFAPVMREELLNGIAKRAVDYADERLAVRYPVQAHARAINLFHLREGHRARVEAHADRFQVLNGGPRFTLDELLLDLEIRPQDYSPNVIMRPLYQETILPNVAYIGGGGELAYWMQLKWLFAAVRIQMPPVMLRTSAALLSSRADRLRRDFGFSLEDLFAPAHELRIRVARIAGGDGTLDEEGRALASAIASARAKAASIDLTLGSSADAFQARVERGLLALQRKMDRALRLREHVQVARIDRVLQELFPGGGLQERKLNLLPMLAARGDSLLDELLEALDPLDPRFTVLIDA